MDNKITSISLLIVLIILSGMFTNKLRQKNNIIEMQYTVIDDSKYKIDDLNTHITMLEREITRTSEVTITFYAPELKGINSDSDHTKTATMQEPVPGWTCAISRDLVDAGWLGKKIWIKGLGIRYANDIMGDSYNGKLIRKQIDICVGKNNVKSEAKKMGNNINIIATAL